jgi:hypothetical protein
VDVVFEENNGKLVLISGPLAISDPLQDPTYEVSINAVKLRKVVQVIVELQLPLKFKFIPGTVV